MALQFPGNSSNYINLADIDAGVSGSFAISCWAYWDDFGEGYRVVAKWGATAAYREYILQNIGQDLLFAFNRGAGIVVNAQTDSEPLTSGTWLHALAQHNKQTGTAQIWVNGTLVKTVNTGAYAIANTANNLLFGNDAGNTSPFSGRLAEVGIWDRWLSAAEVGILATAYTGGPSQYPTNLLGYWPCDETSGTIVADGYGSRDGTWVGAALSWVDHPAPPPPIPKGPLEMEEALEALGSHLIGSISYLGSNGTVWVSDDETYAMAGFSKYPAAYGVQLMNPTLQSLPMMGRTRRQLFEVELRAMRKRGGPLKTRLMGTGGSDKGIYEFAQDIETALLHNRLGTILDPYPGVSIEQFKFDNTQAEVAVARSRFRGWLTSP